MKFLSRSTLPPYPSAPPPADSDPETDPGESATFPPAPPFETDQTEPDHASSLGEVQRLREDLDTTIQRLAEEQTVSSTCRQLVQKAAAEREAAQAELATLRQQLADLQDKSKLESLTAERDALLQQKAYLSAQVAEVVNRRPSSLPGKPGDPAAHGLGPVLTPRQAEEHQRRIAVLEANQKETALQLAREKEARAKAEKLLIAADKLQEESAKYMDTAKAEMRREIEASARPREAELRKAQKELQEQLATISEQRCKLSIDLDAARNRITELEHSTGAGPAAPDPLQIQLIGQLEADIESYRHRLKVLLRERDDARTEAAQRMHATVSTPAGHSAEFEVLGRAKAQLEAELESLRRNQKVQGAAFDALEHDRQQATARLVEERMEAERRCEALREAQTAQLAAFRQKYDEITASHARDLAALEAARDEAVNRFNAETDAARQERERQAREAAIELGRLREELNGVLAERDHLAHRLARLADEHQRLLSDLGAANPITPFRPVAMEVAPDNVIEVTLPAVAQADPGAPIPMPRIRPVSVPPPRVRTL